VSASYTRGATAWDYGTGNGSVHTTQANDYGWGPSEYGSDATVSQMYNSTSGYTYDPTLTFTGELEQVGTETMSSSWGDYSGSPQTYGVNQTYGGLNSGGFGYLGDYSSGPPIYQGYPLFTQINWLAEWQQGANSGWVGLGTNANNYIFAKTIHSEHNRLPCERKKPDASPNLMAFEPSRSCA
jgi:hypothetical protein